LPTAAVVLMHHGYRPERAVQTGIGPIEVSRVKIRDREAASDGERIRFTSAILAFGHEEPGFATAGALPAGYLDTAFPRGRVGLAGQGSVQSVTCGELTDAMAEARSVAEPPRLCLGRRHLPAGPHGRAYDCKVAPGADEEVFT